MNPLDRFLAYAAVFDGDRIALLVDSYPPEDDDALRAWLQKTGLGLAPRYV